MSTKIPIILVTGYLGSGKTTFVNHLLALPEMARRKIALVINEFGKLGVDGALVAAEKARKKYEINSGSLFCSCTKLQLVATLQDIANVVQPDLVMIEATGIAEPADVLSLISDVPSLAERFTVQATVGLIDGKNFTKVAAFLQAARRQAQAVDGLVINKIDLVSESELEKLKTVLADMNPDAPQTAVINGAIDMAWLNSLRHDSAGGPGTDRPPTNIFSASIQTDKKIDKAKFLQTLSDYNANLLRMKGNIDFGDGPAFVELVGDDFLQTPEKSAAGLNAETPTAFAVITWDITAEEITAAFEKTFIE